MIDFKFFKQFSSNIRKKIDKMDDDDPESRYFH